ncbi:MAG: tetratricopeptide repeat protein [bacterium]|nr:tetratricopeptide repeat protein [bacterium]
MNYKKAMICMVVLVLITGIGTFADSRGLKFSLTSIDGNLFEEGAKLIKQGQMEEAVKVFEELIQRQPLNFAVHFYLANLYNHTGRYQGVRALCENALKLFPNGIKHLQKSSFKNSVYGQLYYILGVAYLKLDAPGKAADAFQNILESHNFKVSNSSWIRLYTQSPSKARKFYASVHYKLATAYLSMDKKEAAKDQLRKLKKLDKEKSEKLHRLIDDGSQSV